MNLKFNDQSITVAIVGCGGFIGCHLLDAILTRTKWRVFGVDLDFYRIQHRLNDEPWLIKVSLNELQNIRLS